MREGSDMKIRGEIIEARMETNVRKRHKQGKHIQFQGRIT